MTMAMGMKITHVFDISISAGWASYAANSALTLTRVVDVGFRQRFEKSFWGPVTPCSSKLGCMAQCREFTAEAKLTLLLGAGALRPNSSASPRP